MELLFHHSFFGHDTGMHPENSKRLDAFSDLSDAKIPDGASFVPLIHHPDYIKMVEETCIRGGHLDPDTMVSPGSYAAAINAVGTTLLASQTGGFALVRPPGHHAYPGKASGFCVFNNVAIACKQLVNEGKRVLLFDFDGHLGDGTSHIFYDTDQVMYWSLHQYPAFPGHGFVDEIGEGAGKGFTINVPLPPESGDDIFMDAINTFLPVARAFQPDIVAISAGFDAHQYDLLLELRVTLKSFYTIGQLMASNFPALFATLEGGYNVQVLPQSILNFVAGVNGNPMPFSEKETTSSRRTWEEYELRQHLLLFNLKPYWQF